MSAGTKTSGIKSPLINQNIKKLGILAGGGALPRLLINYCHQNNIVPYVVGFGNQTDDDTYDLAESINARIGASGKIIKWLKEKDIHDVVFIGSIKRPRLKTMIPDWQTLYFFLSKGIWAKGDNSLLEAARAELENRDIKLHGIHNFLPDLLTPFGVLTKANSDDFAKDIEIGILESQNLGRDDIGQAVIVKNGVVIGREDQKGTNSLISRFGQEGAVLVKSCKPQQDKDLDLPTIGLATIKACIDKKMSGIAVHSQNSLFLDREESISLSNKNNFFITGVKI